MSASPITRETLDALLAAGIITQAKFNKAVATLTPAKAEGEAVPYLTCWNAAKADGKATFTHTSKKAGSAPKAYRVLSETEAVALVKANVKAGRIYAVPVK